MSVSGYRVVLAIGAHPDDIELGCGGSLVRAKTAGSELHAVVFSKCEDEAPATQKDLRASEFLRAGKIIGAKPQILEIPNRKFPEHRDEIMREMERLQQEIEPDLVFLPFLEDPHQDHSTIAHAAVRTFRRRETLLQYEILRYGSHTFTPSLFVDIGDSLGTKVRALQEYKSQFKVRAYFDEESFRSLARTRGAQSGYDYAEGFIVHKMYW